MSLNIPTPTISVPSVLSQLGISNQTPNSSGATRSTGSKLIIGGIQLQDFEIPDELGPFGGKQIIAIHEFVGGLRQLQSLGPQPGTISWKGILIGGDPTWGAKPRAIQLDAVRQAGTIIQLSWANYLFDVIISEFSPTINTDWYIPYTISCEVQKDHSAVIPIVSPGPDEVYSQLYGELLANAQAMSNTWAAQNQVLASQLAQDLQTINALKQNSIQLMTEYNLNFSIETLTNDINNLTPVSTGTPLSDAAGAYVLIHQTQNLVNLFSGNTGSQIQTAPIINPNLFEQATSIYGDPNQWMEVAQNNNIPQVPLQTGSFPNFIISPDLGGTSS